MRMILTVVLVASGIFLAVPPAMAAEPLSLEDCIAHALAHHPTLRAGALRHEAAKARVLQEGARPSPSLDLDSDLQPGVLDIDDSGESRVGISQTIELPGRRRTRAEIAGVEATAVLHETSTARLDLVHDVELAFYGLLLAERRLLLATQDHDLAESFLTMARTGFETGDLAQVEVLRAEVEASTAAGTMRLHAAGLELARDRLGVLIGLDPGTPLVVTGAMAHAPVALPDLNELQRRALAARPELSALRSGIAREELVESQARMGAIPDLDLGVSKHRIVGTGSFWNLTLSVPIPLFWGRFRAGIAEARANASALQADLEQAERTIRQEVAEARRNADSACEQTELYRKGILDRAEEVYDMLAFSYRLGEIGGAELIQARRSLLEARSAFADAEHAYAVALAALQRSLGAPLEGAVQ